MNETKFFIEITDFSNGTKFLTWGTIPKD